MQIQRNRSVHFQFSASGPSLCGERARVAQSPPPWQPRLPARKIAASRCPQLIPSGFRVGCDPASMQVAPSPRIPARRPGLTETLRRFSAGLTLPPAIQLSECCTGVGPRRNRRTEGRMTRSGRQGWRPEAKRDRTKLPGAILNSACAGPVGASPMDGTSNTS